MSSSSVQHVTATLSGLPQQTITTVLPSPSKGAHAVSILDPHSPSPVKFDLTNPLALFIVQAFIIVVFSRLLHVGLKYLRQPRVISEIIAGVLIGPTAFGRIPGFTDSVFPAPSIPFLNLVANLGLVLFLFLVGLEVDFSLFRRNVKLATTISLVSMIVPFGMGAAVSIGVYDHFVDVAHVRFGIFLLFIGTANAITAFPVLARILTDEHLLKNPVGVVVLCAGTGNDVVGWLLLALAISLVNSANGIVVLYVILVVIGWVLALWFIGRPVLMLVGRKTGSFDGHGPSQAMTAFVMFLTLTSAWITDRIGIHPIFGGFLAGLVIPKEIRGSLTEKIEDLVTVLLLPLYFASSGLKTDLTLLRTGKIWVWTICVCVVAFASKFLSSGAVAKAFGMKWRESAAVGSLMACKGLVELVVLNIGKDAGILNDSVFAIFVVMALVTTITTTPLTLAFYPRWYREQQERLARGIPSESAASAGDESFGAETKPKNRFAVVVEQFEQLPGIMAFLSLLAPPQGASKVDLPTLDQKKEEKQGDDEKRRSMFKRQQESDSQEKTSPDSPSPATASPDSPSPATGASPDSPSPGKDASLTHLPGLSSRTTSLAALRLVPLTGRTSNRFKSSETEGTLLKQDSLASVLSSFVSSQLGLPTALSLTLTAPDTYPGAVTSFVAERDAELLLVPWALPRVSAEEAGVFEGVLRNPFEGLFGGRDAGTSLGVQGSVGWAGVVRRVFAESPCDVALLLDNSRNSTSSHPAYAGRTHLHLTFHGGSDDRLALSLLAQLVSSNPGLTATVLRVTRAPEPTDEDRAVFSGLEPSTTAISTLSPPGTVADQPLFTVASSGGHGGGGDTVYPTNAGTHPATGGQGALQSETADEAQFTRLFDPSSPSPLSDEARARIHYTTASTASPLRFSAARVSHIRAQLATARVPLLVLVGRGRRDAQSHTQELTELLKEHSERVKAGALVSSEVRRAMGHAAVAAVLLAGEEDPERVMVVQRRGKGGKVGV
ncbi:hypothetical protein JCM10213_002463 [Rhodosporidiobolus nylandii]